MLGPRSDIDSLEEKEKKEAPQNVQAMSVAPPALDPRSIIDGLGGKGRTLSAKRNEKKSKPLTQTLPSQLPSDDVALPQLASDDMTPPQLSSDDMPPIVHTSSTTRLSSISES